MPNREGSAFPSDLPTVCVVDGDIGVRRSLEALLETLPVRVLTFRTAEEFLGCLDQHVPCCLITEVHLPGMSGIDLQRVLRERALSLPVIVLAANADVPIAVRAMHLGAVDFIEKPFVDRIVLARVKEALCIAA